MPPITFRDLAFSTIKDAQQKEIIVFPQLNEEIKSHELSKKIIICLGIGSALFVALAIIAGMLFTKNPMASGLLLGTSLAGFALTGTSTLIKGLFFAVEGSKQVRNRFEKIPIEDYQTFLAKEIIKLDEQIVKHDTTKNRENLASLNNSMSELQNKIAVLDPNSDADSLVTLVKGNITLKQAKETLANAQKHTDSKQAILTELEARKSHIKNLLVNSLYNMS